MNVRPITTLRACTRTILVKYRMVFFLGLGLSIVSFGANKPPREPQTPELDFAAMERLMNERMGKAQLADEAVSADGVQVVFQTGHAYGITALAISRDGRLILSGASDETVKLWDVASGRELRTLTGFGSMGPRNVQISADGARLVVSDMQSTTVFDAASGRKLRSLGQLSMSNLVSDEGRVGVNNGIATGGRAPELIDLATGQVIWTMPLDGDDAGDQPVIALSGDGNTVVTRKESSTSASRVAGKRPAYAIELQVWDVALRKRRGSLPMAGDEQDGLYFVALSANGNLLVTENRDRSLSVYDLATLRETVKIPTGTTAISGLTTTLQFSPDGARIAHATSEGPAKIFETSSGRLLTTLDATAVGFSPDGSKLVLGRLQGGAPLIRDLASGQDTPLTGGAAAIVDLTPALGGSAVVAATVSGAVNVWDLATAQLRRSFECPNGIAASSASAFRAGSLLAIGCMDGSATLWNLASGEKLHDLLPPLTGAFTLAHASFSNDGKILAVGVNETVSVFDAQTGQRIQQWTLPPSASPLAQSQQGQAIYPEEFLKQFPAKQRKLIEEQQAAQAEEDAERDTENSAELHKTAQYVQTIAIHPGRRMLAIGRSYETALWDIETGQMLRQLGGAAPNAASDPSTGAQGATAATSMMDMLKEMQKGGKRGGSWGGLLGGGGKSDAPQIVLPDISEMTRSQSEFSGASSLAFSDDGGRLLTVGSQGKRLWDVASGQEIRSSRAAPKFDMSNPDPQAMMNALLPEEMGAASGTAISADGRLLANGNGRVIKLSDAASGAVIGQLVGHTSNVSALAFVDRDRLLVSGGMDGAVRVWKVAERKEAAALIALGRTDYVAVTPDQYYRASKSHIKGVAFRVNGQLYPFEQFDLRFNRPDVVLERLGLAAPEEVQSYRRSYERRLRKMGIAESMLGTDFHLPTLAIVSKDLPVATANSSLTLRVSAADDKYPLDRINLFVNDVPINGTAGLPLTNKGALTVEQEMTAPLIAGRNKIQVSVLNAQGTESLRQTVYVNSTADLGPADTYVVAIGVSTYKNSAYNLRYAAKDASDLLDAYRSVAGRPAPQGQVHVLDLTNNKATREGIRQAKEFLKQARINDLAIVFAAGHGMTDAQQNYFFGTWDIDSQQPQINGLPYEDFEGLLDGIPAMQKMLLLDTCFSGEIDKDEPTTVAAAATGGAGTVSMRAFKTQRGVSVVADAQNGEAPAPNSSNLLRFQQDWFADLRRGTGAVVISSASGNEFALEGEQWRNGVFTYALLNGLKNRAADANKNGIVTVGELQTYVIDQVRALTDGGQNPTVRRENLEYDFAVF
jgi:WD40 repeat protein